MEDPSLAETPSAARCPASQSANEFLVSPYLQRACNGLKDSSGRPYLEMRIPGMAIPGPGAPTDASEDGVESRQSVPFLFPAFRMAGRKNPTTFITKIQIVYAAIMWFWALRDNRRLGDQESTGRKTPFESVEMGPFIAYFPSGVDWEDRFGALKAFATPFAFLNPSMQEASTLDEPFLPLNELSLPGVHQLMGLGSIWTIGPSLMASPEVLGNSKTACYRLFAFPAHWRSEVPCRDAYALPCHDELCDMTQVFPLVPDDIMSKWEDKKAKMEPCQIATHIGAKSGLSMYNMDWTSHLPARGGFQCLIAKACDTRRGNHQSQSLCRVHFGSHDSVRIFEAQDAGGALRPRFQEDEIGI
ncbi:hypothetical protein FPCIR_13228 [Fusarium pseudocircinatum]|uniref:Uncharacterized protein n=1 Tax=Fusarium pseudocircinatum TaxID=56676 RepID=A0A8H5KJ60_9HYPO|nr:hypothetical protein FPCIR_13228 [Fusarium pseudocircinatum]